MGSPTAWYLLLFSVLNIPYTSSLHSIIVSTSVAPWTPDVKVVARCLESLRACPTLAPVPLWVVADAIPSESEITKLPAVDAEKWAHQWREKRVAYERKYLPSLERLVQDLGKRPGCGSAKLIRLSEFGHLVGTVRAGFEACGAEKDDVILVTQHDLALADPFAFSASVPVLSSALRSRDSPVEYVLLNRDYNNAPRSRAWLSPSPVSLQFGGESGAGDEAMLELCSTGGRFADQTHFVRAGWYRKEVLGACNENDRTCMEHQLHALHGGEGNNLDGATYLYGGEDEPPCLHDLVHGSMIPTDLLPHLFQTASTETSVMPAVSFEPLAETAALPQWKPHPWSVIIWDADTGAPSGALNYDNGDASRPAAAILLPSD